MADDQPAREPAGDNPAALVDRYEQLRAVALAGGGGGGLGLAVLLTGGMAAWIAAWRSLGPPATPPRTPSPAVVVAPDGVVAVLASMAAACIGGG